MRFDLANPVLSSGNKQMHKSNPLSLRSSLVLLRGHPDVHHCQNQLGCFAFFLSLLYLVWLRAAVVSWFCKQYFCFISCWVIFKDGGWGERTLPSWIWLAIMTLTVLVRSGALPVDPTDGLLLTYGSRVGDGRTKTKNNGLDGWGCESQESESSLENHLAKRWVEARNHSMKPKTKRVYEQGAAEWRDKEVVWKESRDKLGMLVETLYLIPAPAWICCPGHIKASGGWAIWCFLPHCPSEKWTVSSFMRVWVLSCCQH